MEQARKGILSSLALLLLLLGFAQYSGAAQKVLATPLRVQSQNQWCWAGVSDSVLSYYTKTIKQCYIADFAWTKTNCCSTPSSCNSPNGIYGSAGSIQGILSHWCISSTGVGSSLTFAQCQAQIINNQPFIIRYGWDSGGGHFIVGRGYKTDAPGYLYLMNPWPGTGYGVFTYDYVKRKVGDHTWTHTLRDIKRNLGAGDWTVTNTTPIKSGVYWNYVLSVREFYGGCGKIVSFYWDFYDQNNVWIARQNNTAADWVAWFDDCADKDFQLPRLTKFCGNLWTQLGGRPSGYVKISFVIKCDSGTTITRYKKFALPAGSGGQGLEKTTNGGYGIPAAGPHKDADSLATQ